MAIPPLPEKKYFKIGEVADLVGVEPHVLRYWETQFSQLRPHKARSGHRLYRRREVETLLVIRELLHVQRFTIAGARQALRQPGGASSLLPRFFEGLAGAGLPLDSALESSALDGARGALSDGDDDDDRNERDDDAVTLVPRGAATEEGRVAEVEVEGLDGEELRVALERQAAEQASGGSVVVEVEVEGVEVPPGVAPPARKPLPRIVTPMAPLHAALSPQKRGLLEDALGDARAILAILDREDAARRAHA